MKINIYNNYEVQVWCILFNCSREEFDEAVEKVGTSIEDLKVHFLT